MSQRNVERLIGRLVTDEGFRRRFARDARAVIQELVEAGCELNECERLALGRVDPAEVDRLASSLDPAIQKIDPQGDLA